MSEVRWYPTSPTEITRISIDNTGSARRDLVLYLVLILGLGALCVSVLIGAADSVLGKGAVEADKLFFAGLITFGELAILFVAVPKIRGLVWRIELYGDRIDLHGNSRLISRRWSDVQELVASEQHTSIPLFVIPVGVQVESYHTLRFDFSDGTCALVRVPQDVLAEIYSATVDDQPRPHPSR